LVRRTRTLVVLASAAALTAGCGSSGDVTATSVANCLNAKGFLVRPKSTIVEGAAPSGIAFTLTLYKTATAAKAAGAKLNTQTTLVTGPAVVDLKGNAPVGGHPPKLGKTDAAAIGRCVR
jgi:hypothetical protein